MAISFVSLFYRARGPTAIHVYLIFHSFPIRLRDRAFYEMIVDFASFEGKYASFKNIKFSRANYQTDSSETKTLYCLYFLPLNFPTRASSKNKLDYFQLFETKTLKTKCKVKKKNRRNPPNTISIVYFLQTRLFTEKLKSSGIFRGRVLWADSVSPRMNTIASHDQFKPIRIGENLVVNYKG